MPECRRAASTAGASIAKFGRPLFSRFAAVLAQNAQVARAIKRLGAPNVIIAGNLKIDSPPPPVDHAVLARLKSAVGQRPVFLAASTHPGEDTVIAAAHSLMRRDIEGLLTIIVPRHPERGGGLAASLGGLGLRTQLRIAIARRRTTIPKSMSPTRSANSERFMRSRPWPSLVDRSSSTADKIPSRPSRHGACVLTGPFTHNFRDAYAALFREGGAIEVRSSDDIARQVTMLAQRIRLAAKRMQRGADLALQSLGGALDKTLGAIQPLLEKKRM